jgi:transcriptional regulator with XRE-family HTH domain
MRITPAECRASRKSLGMSHEDLANAAHVNCTTIVAFEAQRAKPLSNTLEAIQRALEAAGAVFKRRANIQQDEISPNQARTARRWVGWTMAELADKSGVSIATISRFENGKRIPSIINVSRISKTLEAAGVEFTNGGEPGVRLGEAR